MSNFKLYTHSSLTDPYLGFLRATKESFTEIGNTSRMFNSMIKDLFTILDMRFPEDLRQEVFGDYYYFFYRKGNSNLPKEFVDIYPIAFKRRLDHLVLCELSPILGIAVLRGLCSSVPSSYVKKIIHDLNGSPEDKVGRIVTILKMTEEFNNILHLGEDLV